MVEGAKRGGATDLFCGAVVVLYLSVREERARGVRRLRLRSGRGQRCRSSRRCDSGGGPRGLSGAKTTGEDRGRGQDKQRRPTQ